MRFELNLVVSLILAISGPVFAGSILQPAGDKHMYPFIPDSPLTGRKETASVFGAYGALDNVPGYDFDDRDAQFFLDFDTTVLAPAGKGAENYQIAVFEIWVVVESHLKFSLDTSADDLTTYQIPQMDSDPGRPIEIYGVGYRGGFSRSTFHQDSPFQNGAGYKNVRNAFAIDFDLQGAFRDVSNNVELGFEPAPWAIADAPGRINSSGDFVASPVLPGSLVPEGTVLRFSINLLDPKIRTYFQEGLNAGRLHLMVSSLYNAVQQGSDIPRFYTMESIFHSPARGVYLAPRLYGEVSLAAIPPVPKISVSHLIPSGFRVSFDTETGYRYVVQTRDSLGSGNWTAKGETFTGNGQTQFLDDTEANLPARRFYRVAVTTNTP